MKTVKSLFVLLLAGIIVLTAAFSVAAQDEGTTVRIALGSEPDNLDPMLSAATDTSSVMMNVFEGLLAFNQKGEFMPGLAESYTISDDELTYTFTLREGVLFHNGDPLTVNDVVYTYEKLAGLSGGEPLSSTLAAVLDHVETADEKTVSLVLKQKDAGFLSKAIISISKEGYADNATHPIGTGPYKFVEYIPGQKVVLEKNEAYSTLAERTPDIDRVEFIVMTDENARLMGLKSGSLDIAGIGSENIEALGGEFNILEGPQNMVQILGLNNLVEPLNDLRVRQAIAYAVDKDEIIDAVANGSGTRVDSFLSPSMAYYYNNNLNVYEQDFEKSKELLAEAGYPDGFTITVTIPSNYQFHVDTGQVLKDQLANVGINLEIQLVEWAQWLEGVYTNRDYETTIIGHSGKLDPNDFLNRFESNYGRNYFNFSNSDYDKLIADGISTSKPEERKVFYDEAQQFLIDQAASIYIMDPSLVFAVAKNIEGLEIYPVTYFNLGELRIID